MQFLNYDLVDVEAIKKAKFKIVVDAINSSGAIYIPALLKALGVKDVIVLMKKLMENLLIILSHFQNI